MWGPRLAKHCHTKGEFVYPSIAMSLKRIYNFRLRHSSSRPYPLSISPWPHNRKSEVFRTGTWRDSECLFYMCLHPGNTSAAVHVFSRCYTCSNFMPLDSSSATLNFDIPFYKNWSSRSFDRKWHSAVQWLDTRTSIVSSWMFLKLA